MENNTNSGSNDKLQDKEIKTDIKKSNSIVNSSSVISTTLRSGNTTIEEVDLSIFVNSDSKK